MALSEQNKCLTFDNKDLRKEEDPLSGIDSSMYDGIKELRFEFCQMNPLIFGNMLSKLKNIKVLELRFCDCDNVPEDSVPEVERNLDELIMGLDLNQHGFYDCRWILTNPKLILPPKKLTVDRFERPLMRFGDDKGENYWNWFDPDLEFVTYMTWLVERYKDNIKGILFDSGRPKIWRRLAKLQKVGKIPFSIVRDLDAMGM